MRSHKNRRTLVLHLFCVLLCLGCTRSRGPEPVKSPANASEEGSEAPTLKAEACTLSTPLKPGIPGSPGHLIVSSRNPNGDSELSALMRSMHADLEIIRQAIMNGALPESFPGGHERIRCSWPTDLDARNPVFDVLAQGYIRDYSALANSKQGESREVLADRFERVVQGCVTCHENSCRGPIPMIRKLSLRTSGE